MSRGIVGPIHCALAVVAALLLASSSALAEPPGPGHSGRHHRAACAGPLPTGTARCDAQLVTSANAQPLLTSGPAGYGPTDLQSAYNLTSASSTNGGSQTVAIVDAYNDPNAEADLGVYRSQYGLPPCTTANGCFRKVDQNGGSSYPAADGGWSQEISLDLDIVSAICQKCKILLVEANSSYFSDLAAAVDKAAALGATEISNSYGGSEYSTEVADQSHYNHPNVDVTVSSGDSGYGPQFPAASQYVTAVGGTTLNRASNSRGWSESAWSGAGSGCSAYIPKPSWQTDPGCARRTIADVSADADPNTGVAVYDSFSYQNSVGWMVFGGTSVASPILASVDALAGGRSPGSTYGSFPYSNPSWFWDVVGGGNGSCSASYLCTAVAGYDGPTGVGTPNGTSPLPSPSAPTDTNPPTIAGTTTQGQTLTANPGSWTGYPNPTYSYQWQQCIASASPPCTNISGATAPTYTLQSGDVGNTIDVVVTASNSTPPPGHATSAQTAKIASAPADFSLSASPASASMSRNGTTSYRVAVNALAGLTGSVTLSVNGLPAGVTPTWTNNPATSSSQATLKLTGSGAQRGTFTLTISGTAAPNTHTTKVTLTVTRR